MVAVNVGADHFTSEEDHGIVEDGYSFLRLGVAVRDVTLAVFGPLSEVGAQFLLLLPQDVHSESSSSLHISICMGTVGDTY